MLPNGIMFLWCYTAMCYDSVIFFAEFFNIFVDQIAYDLEVSGVFITYFGEYLRQCAWRSSIYEFCNL